MSQENVEAVSRAIEAWNRSDLDAILATLHPDLEYMTTGLFPGLDPVYHGHDGFRRFCCLLTVLASRRRVPITQMCGAVANSITATGTGTQRSSPGQAEQFSSLYHTAKWLNTRRKVLAENPICEDCREELAAEVDHRIPLSQGGDPYALENCSPLCGPCHWQKTAKENAARGGLDDAA